MENVRIWKTKDGKFIRVNKCPRTGQLEVLKELGAELVPTPEEYFETPMPKITPEEIEQFFEKFPTMEQVVHDNGKYGWDFSPYFKEQLTLFLSQSQEEARKEGDAKIRQAVGMMRQWLNEDRITDPKKMVTSENLLLWFDKALSTSSEEKK